MAIMLAEKEIELQFHSLQKHNWDCSLLLYQGNVQETGLIRLYLDTVGNLATWYFGGTCTKHKN